MEVVLLADVQKPFATAEQRRPDFHVSTFAGGRFARHFLEFPAGFGREFLGAAETETLEGAKVETVGRRHGGIRSAEVGTAGKRGAAAETGGLEFHQHELRLLLLAFHRLRNAHLETVVEFRQQFPLLRAARRVAPGRFSARGGFLFGGR